MFTSICEGFDDPNRMRRMKNKSLAIIPARGGSKRLPRKNLRKLQGIPLVAHTLNAVEESGCFDKVLLSSDSPEILDIASGYKTIDLHHRPKELSGDFVTALTLVNSIVALPEIHKEYDIVTLLLPTAPFRTAEHIQHGMELLTEEVDGVVSLTSFEFPPQLSVYMEGGIIKPVFTPCPLITGDTRSQDQAPIYRPNGAFYIQWMTKFLENQNFWKGTVAGYYMERADSADIDTELDLEYAEFMMERRA